MMGMWYRLRGAFRLARTMAYLLRLSVQMRMGFAQLPLEEQHRRLKAWSANMLRCLGLDLVVHGQMRPGAKLVVANHVSWLDIIALNAVEPTRFVSKAEVAQWPVVGHMVVQAGTILLERARRRDAMRVMGLLTQTLRDGDSAAAFPEGTTGDGQSLLPFHGNLLQAAIDADVPIQPVALRYCDSRHAISPAPVYIGDTSLAQSLWWVACAQGLSVHVTPLAAHRVTHADRRALAEALHAELSAALAHSPGHKA
jgi:1-acyl-sn-glycerol-3-phosphate acyltransferase